MLGTQARKLIIIAVVMLFVVLVYLAWHNDHSGPSSSAHTTPPAAKSTTPTAKPKAKPTVNPGGPVQMSATQVAANYVTAYYSINYHHLIDPKTGYTYQSEQEAALSTPSSAKQLIDTQKAAITESSNSETKQIEKEQLVYDVYIDQANIITDAPHTATSELAQVEFTVDEFGVGYPIDGLSTPQQVAQLQMQKVNGRWLVSYMLATPEN